VVPAVKMVKPQPKLGSLFVASRSDLFTDLRAAQIGDIIVVQIVENSSANNKNETSADRTSSINAQIPELFNVTKEKPIIKASTSTKHESEGEINRTDTMTASIACTVIEVLPNNNLILRGSREIQVNGETQFMTIQGIVRPNDVTAENTVLSTQVADARIYYNGQGWLSDKQKPGWAARLVDHIWPF
jgi:flagellar L-ring protein precursor FlgH